MTTVRRVILAMLLPLIALPAAAQSPNTSALIVVVVDQTGGVVSDAKVTVVNNATGAAREVTSGGDGSATIGETATVVRGPLVRRHLEATGSKSLQTALSQLFHPRPSSGSA